MAVGISSAEVVAFSLVLNSIEEHAGMGTTSAGRNPQPSYIATEKKNTASFGKLPHNYKFQVIYLYANNYRLLLIIFNISSSSIPFVDEIEYDISSFFQVARLTTLFLFPSKFTFIPFTSHVFLISYIL
ncbi:hypothetical protein CLOSAC_02990 [Clostridium saccharobutylicum]|uniref:Uncharacterized protein n=1 Tax=Clostridium saccharobutylicum TaxID=169679 RepID=A0A1S8NHZ4_CLOSA|nr:hypothetical protein CLOSAC_02990 [Clostridium saccharobutylicum]